MDRARECIYIFEEVDMCWNIRTLEVHSVVKTVQNYG